MTLRVSLPPFLRICWRRSEATLSFKRPRADSAGSLGAAWALSITRTPAHNESTRDKQVSQVIAMERLFLFLFFIDLSSNRFLLVVNHPDRTRVGDSVLAWPVPNRLVVRNLLSNGDLVGFLSGLRTVEGLTGGGQIGMACCQFDSILR